jgi:RimJ/RimL family protein N-acetyltransferase
MDRPSPVRINEHGQPVGLPVDGWTPRPWPSDAPMEGRFCRLERFDAARHLEALFAAYAEDHGRMWTYLPFGPYPDVQAMAASIEATAEAFPQRFVIIPQGQGPVGQASFMRHAPADGAVEVGAVVFAPRLQRTPAATEAMYLMIRRAFETGYRRYEWKCDALNAASRAAALRLGFTFEGVFRQDRIVRGRNRDTAWFSVLDCEWPALSAAFERWRGPANFDEAGDQRVPLGALIAEARGLSRD